MATVRASAPGSILLTGEHAVIYGHPAIVTAINQRITVTATEIASAELRVRSEIADPSTFPLDALPGDGPYRFVARAVAAMRDRLDGGIDVEIQSEINPTLGLGSSAAVTIATLGGLAHLTGAPSNGLHPKALDIIRTLQGRGSGADLAASLHGSVLAYHPPEATGAQAAVEALPAPPSLSLRYAGYKTPTGDVLAKVAAARVGREAEYDALYAEMGANAVQTISAFKAKDWTAARTLMTQYQGLMARLGVSDETIDQIIADALGTPELLCCKISGSGLGDCVVAMGAKPEGFTPAPISDQGLIIHA